MEFIVHEEKDRLDKYISNKTDEISRVMIQKLIDEGEILVNGKSQKASYKVQNGDKISINIPEVKEVGLKSQDIPLDIIYEDNDILVVNKPKGMVVHPAVGNLDGTLVNAVMAHCKDNLSGIGGEVRPGIVHRLDKDTSGLMVVAKDIKTMELLSDMIKNKKIERQYLAIVDGLIMHETGTIDAPIGRNENNRQKMAVTAHNSKDAVTNFKVLKRFKNNTLIECILETGRTHQIRVHLNYIKHPVSNDPLYGNHKNVTEFGQMLHSKSIRFIHPITGKELYFEQVPPREFLDYLKSLESKTNE